MIKLNGKEYELNEEKVLELLKREGLIKEDELVFSPKVGEEFWYINISGMIFSVDKYSANSPELNSLEQNNLYKTREEAKVKLELNKSAFRIIENMMITENIRTGWKADWENKNQVKYILYFDSSNKMWKCDYATYHIYSCISTSEESAEKIAKYLNDNGIRP